jgi:FlaA1/EpsC-like NDP-sugar epimerase
MTLDQSVDLILNTIEHGSSGEIWIPKLPSMNILDLANIFAKRYDKKIKMIPIRPGEKVAEKLIGLSESLRAREGFGHYILSPAHYDIASESSHFEYTSADDVLSSVALEQYLDNDLNIIEQPMESFIGKNIEEIRI